MDDPVKTGPLPLDGNLIDGSVMLVVGDLERSLRFYREILGFQILEADAWYAYLERANLRLWLVPHSPPTPDKPDVELALLNTDRQTPALVILRVSDCWRAYEELSGEGLVFLTPPQQPSWGGWRCFAKDPDGYLIEIEEPFWVKTP